MNQYIIDEHLVNKICKILVDNGENNLANKLCSCPHAPQSERDKVLEELLIWVRQNNHVYEDIDGDPLPAIVTGRIINKIYELRTPSEAHR